MRWGRAMHKEDKTMKTQLLKVSEESIALGGRLIREGELVGFRRKRSTVWARTRWMRTP